MFSLKQYVCCAAVFVAALPAPAAPSATPQRTSGVTEYKNFMHAYASQLVQSGAAENPYVREWIKKKGAGSVLNELQPPPPMVSMMTAPATVRHVDRTSAGDYLNEMVAHGTHRWSANRFPLRVFIAAGGGPGYKTTYPDLAVSALNEWSQASDGRISWVRTSDPNGADIAIEWSPYTGHGSVESGDTRTVSDFVGNLNHASVNLASLQGGQSVSDAEMKKTCLHELGHALGLCHSSSSGDIMFWQANGAQSSSLCARDMNTISRLYAIR